MEYEIEFFALALYSCALILSCIAGYVRRTWPNMGRLFQNRVMPAVFGAKMTLTELKYFNATQSDGRTIVAFERKIYHVKGDSESVSAGSLRHVAVTEFCGYLNTTIRLEPPQRRILTDSGEKLLEARHSCIGIAIDCLGKPLLVENKRNLQNEDILTDQIILDCFKERCKTKSNEYVIQNALNSAQTPTYF
ncbi:GL12126 [Drosophila persimilis]|uniref:GL12126 n=1 Tax=Drosophila persimilis TaxID=7234 RepID=B4H3C1_DROPE|nr:uncharacterized protein LOC6600296 [Drosophila persimilis]EDW30861.1 GL12126 [Drosophila persimilis]